MQQFKWYTIYLNIFKREKILTKIHGFNIRIPSEMRLILINILQDAKEWIYGSKSHRISPS